jgi:hypothetical protein
MPLDAGPAAYSMMPHSFLTVLIKRFPPGTGMIRSVLVMHATPYSKVTSADEGLLSDGQSPAPAKCQGKCIWAVGRRAGQCRWALEYTPAASGHSSHLRETTSTCKNAGGLRAVLVCTTLSMVALKGLSSSANRFRQSGVR